MSSLVWPMTLSQKDIYFDQLQRPGRPVYNVGGYIQMGDIDSERLKRAHRQLVSNEEIFGLRIVVEVNGVFQTISTRRNTSLVTRDVSRAADPESEASRWVAQLLETPIEIEEK